MAQERAIEIQADRVSRTACPKCGSVVDGSSVPPFSTLKCDKCRTKFASPGKLGGFILLKELGRGQMGVTYKAFEKMLGRYVAIKVMRATLGGDPKRVKDFMAEGRALASLDHPNAVRIYSIGQEKGQPYIAMELVNGRSVGHKMGPGRNLTEARALEIATGVARALKAASEIGLIHSDVKPDNIVLDEKGRAKLVDFGIARFGPGKLDADAAIGTPYYVAPEQVQRGLVDHRTDIYSLGATLHHMISGSPPFPGTDLATVLNARLKKAAPSLMKSCRGLHMETVHVVAKMLQRDPNRRYQDYDELLKDLRRACWASGAELTQDAGDIPLQLAAKGHSSSFSKILVAAIVLFGLAGVGIWAAFFRGKPPPGRGGPDAPASATKAASPIFSPRARKIAGPTDIRVSCDTPNADIRYTTDGTVPSPRSRKWVGAVKVEPGTTLQARAFADGKDPSEIVEAVYARDSVVLKDVVGVRSDARAAWDMARDFDRGQGFGAAIDQCKRELDQAEELYKKNAYAAAKKLYGDVVFKCNGLKTRDSTRKTARIARGKAEAAIRMVSDFNSPAWKPVSETWRLAGVKYEHGEFPQAYELWGKVVLQIDQRHKEMLPAARKSYEKMFARHDQQLLKQHGGTQWAAVEKAIQNASKAADAGHFGQAVSLYRKAENLLAPAAHTAKTAAAGMKLKDAVKAVGDLIAKGQYYKARTELTSALKIAPGDARLKAYKSAIDQAVEISIPLEPNAKDERGGLLMKFSLVTPGKFMMGSPKEDESRDIDETLHEVEITKPYYIAQCEVSRRQFEHFIKVAKYKTAVEKNKRLAGLVLVKSHGGKSKLARSIGKSWRDPGFGQGGDHPVVCVTWEDANAFCQWMSERAGGMKISLPTEAQWEYACRRGARTAFSFGDDPTKLCQYGNYADGTSGFAVGDVRNSDGQSTTAPVGSYKRVSSPPLVYDMHGNVAEWCRDFYGIYPRGSDRTGKALVDPIGPPRGSARVVRGGSWASSPAKCRSASRDRGGRGGIKYSALIGFRVIATGKPPRISQLPGASGNPLKGMAGLGTWQTHAKFQDFHVKQGDREIWRLKDFRRELKAGEGGRWLFKSGERSVEQTDANGKGNYACFGDVNWSNYSVLAKAMKIKGKEGFRLRFADDGKGNFYLFCLGGQFGKKHLIERHAPGRRDPEYLVPVDGKIDPNRWHDVRVELRDRNIKCFLDDKLTCEYNAPERRASIDRGRAWELDVRGVDLLAWGG